MLSVPIDAWTRDPTHSANSGPPVQRLRLTSVVRTPSTIRMSTDRTPRRRRSCCTCCTCCCSAPRGRGLAVCSIMASNSRLARLAREAAGCPRHPQESHIIERQLASVTVQHLADGAEQLLELPLAQLDVVGVRPQHL